MTVQVHKQWHARRTAAVEGQVSRWEVSCIFLAALQTVLRQGPSNSKLLGIVPQQLTMLPSLQIQHANSLGHVDPGRC